MTQSPQPAPQIDPPSIGDLAWLAVYATRGLFELIRARLIFARLQTKDIIARNNAAKGTLDSTVIMDTKTVSRIAYVIPRLSDRLPWRSDCLIQAIAGQNWLKAKGADSEIQIGVENPKDGDFGAHAWLVHNDTIVTGGDIARYALLLGDSI